MEITQNFMDEMRGMMKVLISRSETQGAQIEGLYKEVKEIRETMATKAELAELRKEMFEEIADIRATMATKAELAELRANMATKDDIQLIHEQLADIKSDNAYLKRETARNSIDIYHLKLQMTKLKDTDQ